MEDFDCERETRLELATFSLARRRSSQLSYSRNACILALMKGIFNRLDDFF